MQSPKRIVIVGATSAIAEHCARLWVTDQTVQLTLIGRSITKMERVAQDLRVRSPLSEIHMIETDFLDPIKIKETVDTIANEALIDLVLIAQGSLSDQKTCETDLTLCNHTLAINGISPILFSEAFILHMLKKNNGKIVMLGSVAGDRGRQSNYIYGAAKGMLERYAQGVQHRLAKTSIQFILVKPGPTDTPMTAHLKKKGFKLAKVSNVAQTIVTSANQNKLVIYAPARWGLIMLVIKKLPLFIFNRLSL